MIKDVNVRIIKSVRMMFNIYYNKDIDTEVIRWMIRRFVKLFGCSYFPQTQLIASKIYHMAR